MAFKSNYLRSVNPLGGGPIWGYKTEDTTYANYFPSTLFSLGDRIFITVVDNLSEANETYVSSSTRVVSSISGTYATIEAP